MCPNKANFIFSRFLKSSITLRKAARGRIWKFALREETDTLENRCACGIRNAGIWKFALREETDTCSSHRCYDHRCYLKIRSPRGDGYNHNDSIIMIFLFWFENSLSERRRIPSKVSNEATFFFLFENSLSERRRIPCERFSASSYLLNLKIRSPRGDGYRVCRFKDIERNWFENSLSERRRIHSIYLRTIIKRSFENSLSERRRIPISSGLPVWIALFENSLSERRRIRYRGCLR